MANDWKECSLGDVIELKRGYDLPQKERLPGDVPLVSSSGVTDTHAKAMVKGPGVVTGRYGTLGQVFYVEQDFWPLNTTLYVRDFKGNDPRFISYFLRDVDFLAYSDKAAVPGLNRNHLHQARVRIPTDPTEQRAIADILGTLDNKIELNRKQNETLEAMARTLFKAWFVDFEPVRAKLDGRWQHGQSLPGLPGHLYDVFPDRLVNSEQGEIPEGWEISALGDFVETVKGRSYKSEELAESTTALVTLKSFARGGGYRTDGLKSFTGKYKQEQVIAPGEVVIACTDVTQAAELIGRAAIVRRARRYQTLVASLDTMIVRPRSERVTRAFLYYLGRSDSFVAHTYSHTTGTTVLHLGKEAIPTYRFVLPPRAIVRHFDVAASNALARTDALEDESERLVALRNTLLPKLISGELRIQDAERIVGAAV